MRLNMHGKQERHLWGFISITLKTREREPARKDRIRLDLLKWGIQIWPILFRAMNLIHEMLMGT